MKRRSFLGALFAAPVAATMDVPAMSSAPAASPGYAMQAPETHEYLLERLGSLRKSLKTPPRAETLKMTVSVYGIDPDIDAIRSFSKVTKMRMQQERQIEREQRMHRGYIQREIDGLLEQLGPLGDALRD